MRILLSWLEEFVDIPEYPDVLAHELTMAGLAVDAVNEEKGETLFELDITSNRPDAMNHFGVAREIAAIFQRPLRPPKVEVPESDPAASSKASIEILDSDLCPRYSARVMLGVEVKPSPDWIRRRLELCGVRSINNIADLTNYVLLEVGHPTHAFDLDLLDESKIVVRRAQPGELLRTLDGVDRTLSAQHLVIADAMRPVALAGVMGGLESEISDSTRNVLIESAWFDPGSIRRTSRYFGMHTEASHRFERGADPQGTVWAADRIAGLLSQVSAGTVLRGCLDAHPKPHQPRTVTLRRRAMERLLGLAIPEDDVQRIMRALGFGLAPAEGGWQVQVPSYRLDVSREVDVIEEIARIYGYDRFTPQLPSMAAAAENPPLSEEETRLRTAARSLGYDETIGYSFISTAEAAEFGAWPAVPLRNPVSELWDVMRNSAIPGMIRALEWNLNHNESNVRLMEIGRLYRAESGGHQEPPVLTLGATGLARPRTFSEPGKPYDFYEFKADVAQLLAAFEIHQLSFEPRELPPYYAAGRSARAMADGAVAAYLGELDPKRAAARKIRQPIFVAEILLENLYKLGLRRPQHRALSRVPPVYRDFSLLVPEGVTFEEVRTAVGFHPELTTLEPVEIFRGAQVSQGHYSLLLRAIWQRAAESFTDDEINRRADQIVQDLHKKLGVELRSS
jgi:phenylalanyl-tRNA synthetase beta chain